ncbi:hypothetical protein BGZ88_011902 [Linnemannia elongata]|nr:hypothetical protein BGZ88_011902 [Linnemannia elongata]
MTRKGLSKHLTNCAEVSKVQFPLRCPYCDHECLKLEDFSKHASDCMSWEEDRSKDGERLDEFEKQLIRVTRHPATSLLVKRLFDSAELRLPDGSTEMALIMPSVSKRLRDGSKAHVRILKPHERTVVDQTVEAASTKLDVVLESHSYGRLINLEDYRSLDNKDPVWHFPFPDNGERLATMLEGLLLHSGEDVLLALKVEVYGTADYEDPHAQDIARPEGTSSFKVVNVCHDNTHKIMIGTIKWCALVTLAVMLTDGTVIVGPDNKILQPRSTSCIWIKKDPGPFVYNTMPRQLRSKFFESATFARYAAVHQLFNHHTSMPVTLKTLYGFKSNKAWSGIKVAAFVFHELFAQKKVVKADVIKHIYDALELRKGSSCELLNIIQEMACEMREEEVFPVSKPVNKCLTELAGKLSSEITNLNHTDVLHAVEKKIKSMLLDSE